MWIIHITRDQSSMSDRRMQISSYTTWNLRRPQWNKSFLRLFKNFRYYFVLCSLKIDWSALQCYISYKIMLSKLKGQVSVHCSAKARTFIPKPEMNFERDAVSSAPVVCFICGQFDSQIIVWRPKDNFQTRFGPSSNRLLSMAGERFLRSKLV